MTTRTGMIGVLALLLASPAAMGTVIYSTLNGTDGHSRGGNLFTPWLDDVRVENGGVLSQVRFSLMVDPFAGVEEDQITDATLFIFVDLDDEDGNPDPNDPGHPQLSGIDPLIFKQTLTDLPVPLSGISTFTLGGLAAQNILIPDTAKLWVGVTVSNQFNIAMPLTGPASPGSTNGDIYNFIEFIGDYLPNTLEEGPNTAGLALELSIVPEPAAFVLLATASGAVLLRRRR